MVGVCGAVDITPELVEFDWLMKAFNENKLETGGFPYAAAIGALRPLERIPGLSTGILLCITAVECASLHGAFPQARLFMYSAAAPMRKANIAAPTPHVTAAEALSVLLLREMLNSDKVAVVASSNKLAEEMLYAVGIRPKVALPASYFMYSLAATYNPSKRILFYGRLFLTQSAYKHLLEEIFPERFPFSVIIQDDNRVINYEDFSRFRAIAFFPWNMHSVAFTEMYTLAIPLFVPDANLIAKIERLTSFPDQVANVFAVDDPDYPGVLRGGVPFDHLYSPYWPREKAPLIAQVRYWWQYSYMSTFPHIQTFKSLTQLLAMLQVVNFEEISKNMMTACAQIFKVSTVTTAQAIEKFIYQDP